jgi:hypothetical protein
VTLTTAIYFYPRSICDDLFFFFFFLTLPSSRLNTHNSDQWHFQIKKTINKQSRDRLKWSNKLTSIVWDFLKI